MGNDGIEWEEQVEGYLSEHGYDTQTRARIAGHEIDVFGQRFDERIAVECKDWTSPVGISPIRDIKSKADDIDARPGIAYTSRLTSDAMEKARRWEFELISYERLCYDDSGLGRVAFLDTGEERPTVSPAALADRIVGDVPALDTDPVATTRAISNAVADHLADAEIELADDDSATGDGVRRAEHALALRWCSLDLDALAATLAERMADRGHATAGIEQAVKHGLESELPVDAPETSVRLLDGNEVLFWRPETELDPIPVRATAEAIRRAADQHVETDAVTLLSALVEDLTELLDGTGLSTE